jgi:hypothetical protein
MTWADFYLVCFVVGFFLSALMFLGGSLHLHFPHFHFHGAAHGHIGGAHARLKAERAAVRSPRSI